MVGKLYRTQILLEPEQHQELSAIAKREGRSISELVREFVQCQLEQRKAEQDKAIGKRVEAFERILQRREQILAERGGEYIDFDFVQALHEAREEQDERNFSLLPNTGD
ncbi:MAG: ribbon-helix-helix domain-containing protein [Chloroflexota bacterium]|nr:ribbon-helix-helix domain-containing protein [Chloroflexota bacterium]